MGKKRVVKVRASTTTPIPSNDGTTNPLGKATVVSSSAVVNAKGVEVAFETKNEDKEVIPVLVVENEAVAIQEGEDDRATNLLQEEVAVETVKGETTKVVSDIDNDDIHSNGEGVDEETTDLVMKNGEVATEEWESEEVAIDKEKIEMAAIEGEVEDEGFDEPNSPEEGDDEQMAEGEEEVGEYSEEEDEEEDDDEDGDEEVREEEEDVEEEEKEEEQMEIRYEEAREEEVGKGEENVEESLLVTKTEEKIEVNSEVVAKKLTVQSRLKKVGTKVEDKPTSSKKLVASAGEDEPGASSKKKVATIDEDKPKALSKKKADSTVEDKPEASSQKKGLTAVGNKPESSGKKKASKRVQSMGLIFMCSSKTKQDCYRYKVLGLPASKKELVQKIYKGMRLFLFDIDLRLMYGIYKAAGPGGYNIQPKAFGSAFPSQVRFTVVEDCLPVAEEKFKHILKENYYAKKKFDCQLTSEQVKNLCKLFSSSGRVPRSKKPKNVVGTETRPDTDRAKRPGVEGERLGRGRIRRKRLDAGSLDLRPRLNKEKSGRGRIRRERLDEESIERARIRRQILDEERLDRERIRQQRQEEEMLDRDRIRRQRLDEESWAPRYHDRIYERERYASPLPPPSRAYDPYARTADTALYMRDPVVDHRERVPVSEHRGRLPAVDHHDRRILDLDLRSRDEVGLREPYASYREYNLPHRAQAATYPSLPSSASEYRRHEEAPGYEYGSLRSLYRY